MQGYLSEAKKHIEGFTLDESHYTKVTVGSSWFTIENHGENLIFSNTNMPKAKINIKFKEGVKGNKIFFGKKIRGNIEIIADGSHGIIYIGNFCRPKKLEIHSKQDDDCILIGNDVTTHRHNSEQVTVRSGSGSGSAKPTIIIGDDCMFSHGIVVRNSDSHPIFDVESMTQVNEPTKGILIEPHTWIGEGVTILKNVTIGACSIIAAGSIVTKDVGRFSVAAGIPATSRKKQSKIWSKDYTNEAKEKALFYRDKYLTD